VLGVRVEAAGGLCAKPISEFDVDQRQWRGPRDQGSDKKNLYDQQRNFRKSAIGRGAQPGHDQSQLHTTCVRAREDERRNLTMEAAAEKISLREHETMGRLFRVLHDMIKRTNALASTEHLVYLLDECGTDVGDKEHSRITFGEMVFTAKLYQKKQLKCFFS